MNTQALLGLDTPAALVDRERLQRNLLRMQQQADALGVRLRPHVKTSKCAQVALAQQAAGARGITVSTLKEAREFFAAGHRDILYAVGMAPARLPAALALRQAGCDLKLIVDSPEAAQAIVAFGRAHRHVFEVWLEIDTDGHRSGLDPKGEALLAVGRALHAGGMVLGGVLTHAGSSYDLDTPQALQGLAEQERAGAVLAASRLREVELPCPEVSVGSTPTALAALSLEGVTELRAGVYAFFDLVMFNVGVCSADELALSVLTTVIGHQSDKGWAVVDAGWMAMSRDRGTAGRRLDFGYGQACTLEGRWMEGYRVTQANQEHGIVERPGAPDTDICRTLPLGSRLRILPNHACATGAQFPDYQVLAADGSLSRWDRFQGW